MTRFDFARSLSDNIERLSSLLHVYDRIRVDTHRPPAEDINGFFLRTLSSCLHFDTVFTIVIHQSSVLNTLNGV